MCSTVTGFAPGTTGGTIVCTCARDSPHKKTFTNTKKIAGFFLFIFSGLLQTGANINVRLHGLQQNKSLFLRVRRLLCLGLHLYSGVVGLYAQAGPDAPGAFRSGASARCATGQFSIPSGHGGHPKVGLEITARYISPATSVLRGL